MKHSARWHSVTASVFAANEKIHHLFKPTYGAFVFEAAGEVDTFAKEIGHTTEEYAIEVNGEKVCLDEIQKVWEATLEPVYPMITKAPNVVIPSYSYECKEHAHAGTKIAQPQVLIPVFPGTNCEYDTARAFERAGAKANIVVIRNKTSEQIKESVALMKDMITKTQIIATQAASPAVRTRRFRKIHHLLLPQPTDHRSCDGSAQE